MPLLRKRKSPFVEEEEQGANDIKQQIEKESKKLKKHEKINKLDDFKSMLANSDQISSEQEYAYIPSDIERSNISKFCSLSLKCKQLQYETANLVKSLKPQVKKLREDLLGLLKESKEEVLLIPQEFRKKFKLEKGFEIPAYIRLSQNTKDLSITPQIVQEAINAISEDDLLESVEDNEHSYESLINLVISSVRRLIRSFNEQPKICDSVPRGVKACDVKVAEETLIKLAFNLFEKSEFVLQSERKKREQANFVKRDMELCTGSVKDYFERSQLTSQRVSLENKSYNLCYRTTVKRPKINAKMLGNIMHDTLKDCDLICINLKNGQNRPIQKHELLAKFKKGDFCRVLLSKLSAIEAETKKSVYLQSLKSSDEEEHGDDAEENGQNDEGDDT